MRSEQQFAEMDCYKLKIEVLHTTVGARAPHTLPDNDVRKWCPQLCSFVL